MKCQILFSGKNKKNIINLSSAENAQRVVKVNIMVLIMQKYETFIFLRKNMQNNNFFTEKNKIIIAYLNL